MKENRWLFILVSQVPANGKCAPLVFGAWTTRGPKGVTQTGVVRVDFVENRQDNTALAVVADRVVRPTASFPIADIYIKWSVFMAFVRARH